MVPVLLLLLGGGTDLARAYFVGIETTNAARAAALYVAHLDPTSGPINTADLQSAATQAYTGSLLTCSSTPTIIVSPASVPAQTGVPTTASFLEAVTVKCQLGMITPLIPSPVTIQSTSTSYVVEP